MGLALAISTFEFFLISLLEIFFIIFTLLYFKIRKKDPKYEFLKILSPQKRSIKFIIINIIIGIVFGVFFYYLGNFVLILIENSINLLFGEEFLNSAAQGSVDVTPSHLSIFDLLFCIGIEFILVGFCEEYFFRGFFYNEYNKFSKKRGILISGLIFSIFHVIPGIVPIQTTITYFPYYLFIAMMFSLLLYYQKGDILSIIIAHGTFNSIILILNFIAQF